MPPKNAIREIRINQNPFSPEYDKLGFVRIEIFTKPGTDKFRGSRGYNFANDSTNSRNAYAAKRALFHLNELSGTLSGPISYVCGTINASAGATVLSLAAFHVAGVLAVCPLEAEPPEKVPADCAIYLTVLKSGADSASSMVSSKTRSAGNARLRIPGATLNLRVPDARDKLRVFPSA